MLRAPVGAKAVWEIAFQMTHRAIQVALIAVSVLLATSTADAQSKAARIKSRARNAKSPASDSVMYKLFPDYDAFGLSWKDYEQRRRSDLVEMNAVLYDLSDAEQTRVRTLIDKVDDSPKRKGKADGDNAKIAELINERAKIARSIEGKFDREKAQSAQAQRILMSSGLMKVQSQIAALESKRDRTLDKIRPMVESMIGPERTQLAHAQWNNRLEQARNRIAIKSLTATVRPPAGALKERAKAPPARRQASKPPITKMRPVSPTQRRSPPARRTKATRRPSRRMTKPAAGKSTTPPRTARKTPTRRTARATPHRQTAQAPAIPLDKWEQYVKDFLEDYECTAEQTHSALSILDELKGRAERHQKFSQKQIAAANEIKDRRERQKRLDAINAPVDRLFGQLKQRLDGLLTTHQRALKRASEAKARRSAKRRS